MTVWLANAPVSFGAFELSGDMPHVPHPSAVLDAVSEAGYQGIDLGPLGYLAPPSELADALSERSLGLAGGYCALPFTAPDFRNRTKELEEMVEALVFIREVGLEFPLPKPTLADAGSKERLARLRGASRGASLNREGWKRLLFNVQYATDLCRSAGLEPTFHHHAGSFVETAPEIDRLLEGTDVDLCLDTGHVVVGGGDPVNLLARLHDRINHVHVKDVRAGVLEGIIREKAEVMEIWRRGVFCPIGEGSIDFPGFLDLLSANGYDGWIVVEQDRLPTGPTDLQEMIEDQVANISRVQDLYSRQAK